MAKENTLRVSKCRRLSKRHEGILDMGEVWIGPGGGGRTHTVLSTTGF